MKKKKIIHYTAILALSASLRKKGKRIVFTNGCFDILHAGHVSYLSQAKKIGDVLCVGVNSDASVRAIKGTSRPINRLKDRMEVLASLGCVDVVCAFNQTTPLELIKLLRPHVLVKGADWSAKDIIGADVVKSYGGSVKTLAFKKGYSTTALIKKIIRYR